MQSPSRSNLTFAWVWLSLLAFAVAFLGGSSRPDAIQIVALRPLAALLLIPAFYFMRNGWAEDGWALLWMTGLLFLWTILQIVPLPPEAWVNLPGREPLVELSETLGLSDEWRPLSVAPSRTWHSLASLIVPLCGLLLALSLRANARMLLLLVVSIGLLDAVLGLLQVISGRTSALYFYAITNPGSPVGVFANENHSAVFSAIVLLVLTRLAVTAREARDPYGLRYGYLAAMLTVFLAILISGSRAGFAMSVFAILVAGLQLIRIKGGSRDSRRNPSHHSSFWSRPSLIFLLFAAFIILLLGAFFSLEKAPGIEDLLDADPLGDLRWQIVPVLERMIQTYWLLGTGFGSFEEVYRIYEPTGLQGPLYVNQAHNDWAQYVIEGGLPAIGILAALFAWIARRSLSLLQQNRDGLLDLVFWWAVAAILLGASIVDYPLRTPTFQLAAIWLLVAFAKLTAYDRTSTENLFG